MTTTYKQLAASNNYLGPMTYLKNQKVTEYDMESAGLNILTDLGHIDLDLRANLMNMSKTDRNIAVGNILKGNKFLVEELERGFAQARQVFLEENQIAPEDIVSIKKDAIFILGEYVISTTQLSEHLKIRPKEVYDYYLRVDKFEFYYNSTTGNLDVKGFSKAAVQGFVSGFFIKLKEVFNADIVGDTDSKFLNLAMLKQDLVTYTAPLEYYLDPRLGYYLVTLPLGTTQFAFERVEPTMKSSLTFTPTLGLLTGIISKLL